MSESNPKVRLIGEPQSVPVFNCRVIVSRNGSQFVARAAELAALSTSGESQREALQKLVAAFKAQMTSYVSAGQEIPWVKPGQQVQPGETELFVAVHL